MFPKAHDLTIEIDAKSDRRFDRPSVIFKFSVYDYLACLYLYKCECR